MKTKIWITVQLIQIWISKISEWLLDESDSNPYSTYSNPNSSEGCLDGLIRISSKRFESLVKKEVKLRANDSNHLHSNSNPSWRTCEENETRIQITYTKIRIHEFGVMENKARQFESSSYGFKSLLKLKLKVK